MENIYWDFNNKSKSKIRVTFGILFILLGIANLFLLLNKQDAGTIEILNPIVFPLLGLYHIFDGLGSKLKDKIGKRFLSINENEIVVKYDFFGEAIKLEWDNIKSIYIKLAGFEFTTNDNKLQEISVSRLDYSQTKEIKKYIKSMAGNISITEK